MTLTENTLRTERGFKITYPNREYTLSQLSETCRLLERTWIDVLIVLLRTPDFIGPIWTQTGDAFEDVTVIEIMSDDPPSDVPDVEPPEMVGSGEEAFPIFRERPRLVIRRIHYGSPLEITLALQGGGGTAIVLFAMHLFRKAVKNPDQVGAWLGKALAGWHGAMEQAEEVKDRRTRAAEARMELSATEFELLPRPIDLTLLGVEELPDELARLLDPPAS